ncbi:unnamed protein product [Dracunculus medinensis]|uniref:JmjC domain-containing protein n=1 Tax=Dracunculus medinensis TaxID=318479 RepID=A0A3P7SAW3_DRAME|nr:unnamed protein product [Dracunculus medinensis]
MLGFLFLPLDEEHEEWSTSDLQRVNHSINCNIERYDANYLTQKIFEERFAYIEPVVIFNIKNNKFSYETRKRNLLKNWKNAGITLNSANSYSYKRVATTLNDYVNKEMKAQKMDKLGNETLILFGDIDGEIWGDLLNDYNLPKWFLPNYFPALSFGIAASRTGVPFHFHGPVFAEVIHGSKLWFLYPFNNRPEFDPDESSFKWFIEKYPDLKGDQRPLQCLLRPGEILYIPDKWWHATLNAETSVFISTFLSPS